MSLKYEQYRALARARVFLRSILSQKARSQHVLKELAYGCLKHFPFLKHTGEPMFSMDPFECGKIDFVALEEWAKGDWVPPKEKKK